jgi:hypothetical protein
LKYLKICNYGLFYIDVLFPLFTKMRLLRVSPHSPLYWILHKLIRILDFDSTPAEQARRLSSNPSTTKQKNKQKKTCMATTFYEYLFVT